MAAEVMVFHTTGAGGRTLESIVGERDVAAVVDMSLVEVNDFPPSWHLRRWTAPGHHVGLPRYSDDLCARKH